MEGMLWDWSASLAISFLFTEPVLIVTIVAMPCIFKRGAVQKCMDAMQALGIDPTLLA